MARDTLYDLFAVVCYQAVVVAANFDDTFTLSPYAHLSLLLNPVTRDNELLCRILAVYLIDSVSNNDASFAHPTPKSNMTPTTSCGRHPHR